MPKQKRSQTKKKEKQSSKSGDSTSKIPKKKKKQKTEKKEKVYPTPPKNEKEMVGVDEAGRGCGLGPLVAAAVMLPVNFESKMPIRDSKQVDDKEERQMLADYVKESAIAWAAVEMPIEVIDEKNIDYANFIGMQRAMDELAAKVEKLKQEEPEEKHKIPSVTHVLIDGKRFWPHKTITHECVVKGDSKHLSIAAASLIAKTTRDARIAELVKDNEELLKPYHVEENIGYFSAIHMSALKEHGPTALHRLSYQPCYDGAMKHWAGNAEKMKLLHQRAGNSTAAKKYARKQAKAEK